MADQEREEFKRERAERERAQVQQLMQTHGFEFEVPVGVLLQTGSGATLRHLGGGRFVTQGQPGVVLDGVVFGEDKPPPGMVPMRFVEHPAGGLGLAQQTRFVVMGEIDPADHPAMLRAIQAVAQPAGAAPKA